MLWGYEYGTDAHIIARKPSDQADTRDRILPVPDPYFEHHASADWKPLGPRELSDEHCDCGTGEVECECCGHRSMCEWCQGTKANHAWIGKFAVRVKYDAMIRSLPGDVEYAEATNYIIFRCGEVEGALSVMLDADTGELKTREM